MDENFKRKRGSELARIFEEGLKKQQFSFFDLEDYEEIISYYMSQNKARKALSAAKQAESQYPFSVEIMLLKAQTLISMESFKEALEVLASAETFQPNEAEIFMIRGSLFSLQLKVEQAHGEFNKALLFAENKDDVYYHLGVLEQSQECYDKAIEYYEKL